eukprot:GFUD01001157.1.p1 GENE.GFUD01001157.1~~GFUD01001157.1.p1  ORF type:complete len:316 (+),score=69.08 GFUD01001157.1:89-1036(+)
MPSPISGGWRWPASPRQQQQRSKSKPKEVLPTNFDKLFEDEKLRRRSKSCHRTDRVFEKKDTSLINTQICRNSNKSLSLGGDIRAPVTEPQTRYLSSGGQYKVAERTSTHYFLQKLTRRSSKTPKEVAEEVRSAILEVCCSPSRSMPGHSVELSSMERIEFGLDCDEVVPRVILATGKTVKNVPYMRELRVTHIINTASRDVWLPVEKLSNLGVEMFQFHVDDVPSANIAPYFTPAAEFVDRAAQMGGLLVINCLVGLSRSATILAAALMINNKWTVKRALKKLRQNRPVKPNLGFMVQLLTLEKKLKEQGMNLQ